MSLDILRGQVFVDSSSSLMCVYGSCQASEEDGGVEQGGDRILHQCNNCPVTDTTYCLHFM